MRKYAWLREPFQYNESGRIYKVMLYETEEGSYLFGYGSAEAVRCSFDRFYASVEELHEDWDDLIDERGWIGIEDPLPYCQHDAFIPVRVKGRNIGRPEWGKYEILMDGEWFDYTPSP